MQGLHLIGDLFSCDASEALLTQCEALRGLCRAAMEGAGLAITGEQWAPLPPVEGHAGGVTGILLLAHSHLAIHTAPERRGVALDLYVCDRDADHRARAERAFDGIVAQMRPERLSTQRVPRPDTPDSRALRADLKLEWLNAYSAFGTVATRELARIQSPWQCVEVLETPQFGRLFRLDGRYMSSEGDEFFCHEPMVHPMAIAHPAPRTALVIGGGDGGSSEELLKHPGMERVVMAELDPAVIEMAKAHLPGIHRGVFDDPRLAVRIGDGFTYANQTDERFDLIVLDLTDPDTPARALYTDAFFDTAKRLLRPGGAMSLHLGSPVHGPATVRTLARRLRRHFPLVRPFAVYVPLYGTLWCMAIASEALDPLAIGPEEAARRLEARGIGGLQYYNAALHPALFALPTFVQHLLA